MKKLHYILFLLLLLSFGNQAMAQRKFKVHVDVTNTQNGINPSMLRMKLLDGTLTSPGLPGDRIFDAAQEPIGARVTNGSGSLDYTLRECSSTLLDAPPITTAFHVITYGTPKGIGSSAASGSSGEYCEDETVTLVADVCYYVVRTLGQTLDWEVSLTGDTEASYSLFRNTNDRTTTIKLSDIPGATLGSIIYLRVKYKESSGLGYSPPKQIIFRTKASSFSAGQVVPEDPACFGEKGKITINGTNSLASVTQFSYRLQIKAPDGSWAPANIPNATQDNQNANNTPVVFTGLIAGTYRVAVVNQPAGCAPGYSQEILIKDAPNQLAWDAPTCSNCSSTSGTTFRTQCLGGMASITFANLRGGKPGYKYRVYESSASPSAYSSTGTSLSIDLAAGEYIVEFTDQNSCTPNPANYTITVTEPPIIGANLVYPTKSNGANVSCPGANDGEIKVTPTGGVGPFNLVLKKAGVTVGSPHNNIAQGAQVTFSGLVANATDYTVEISEVADGTCKQTINVNALTEPAAITATIERVQKANGHHVSCATTAVGGSSADGELKITPHGGVGPFTIKIKEGTTEVNTTTNVARDAAATLGGLSAGILYTVEIIDNSTCTTISTFSQSIANALTAPPAPIITTNLQHITCKDGSNGKIEVIPSGGANGTAFTVGIEGGAPATSTSAGSTVTFDNLTAGNYTVVVKDGNNCEFRKTVNLTEPTAIGASIALGAQQVNGVAHISCKGASDGSISVNPSGGGNGSPYTVVLNGPNSFSDTKTGISIGQITTFTGLAAGSYTVTVSDKDGCAATFTKESGGQPLTLTEPNEISATFNPTPITCFNGNDGKAILTISGGNNYMPASITLKDINDGSKTFAAATQLSANQFEWTGLSAGNYQVTITDSKGCQLPGPNDKFDIVQPTQALALSVETNTPATCNGEANGKVTVKGVGGWGSYLYSNDGANFTATPAATHLFDNLAAGDYQFWVKDNLGCIASITVTVAEPTVLMVSPNITHVKCNGENNGSVTLNASGANGNYTYSTQPNSGFTTNPTFTTLTEGTRTFYVRSNGNCVTSIEVTINEPAVLTASVEVTKTKPISCFGANDGEVTLNIAGGTSDYMVSVDGGTPVTINAPYTISGLSLGDHALRVIDAKGCFVETVSGIITEPTTVQVSLVSKKETACVTAKGSATVTATGGTGTYTYQWYDATNTPVSSLATASGLATGTYRVEVKDANNCAAPSFEVVMGSVPLPDINLVNSTRASCGTVADGTATIAIVGGVSTVTVLWDNGQTGLTATGLSAGIHNVTLTDGDNCSVVRQVEILEVPAMALQATEQINLACKGDNTGKLSVEVTSGGVAPYSYVWNTGATGSSISNLIVDTYTVTVTDAKGCTQMKSFTLTEPAVALTLNETSKTPTSCNGNTDGSVTVQGAGGDGSYLYSKDGTNFQAGNTFTGLGAGAQDIWVRDGLGCEVKTTISIVSPPALVPKVVSISHVDCNGGNNGSVTLGADGGEGDYTYSTNATGGFTTNPTFTILSATTYTYYVRTKNKCTTPINFTINEPAVLTASVDVSKTKPISCFGTNDGEVTLNIAGGTSDYMVSVDGGTPVTINAPYTISGLSRGDHTLRVIDAKGCFVETASGIITEPTTVQVSLVSKKETACVTAKGSATVTATGGTGTYTYQWYDATDTPVSSLATASGLATGTYRVEVKDANNCAAPSFEVVMGSVPLPDINLVNSTRASCSGVNDGTATIEIVGGVGPVSVVWANGQTGLSATGLQVGINRLTLTDGDNCTVDREIEILEAPAMVIQAAEQINLACKGGNTGKLRAEVTSGGVAPYSYVWNTGATGSSINNLIAGTYTVTVTDAKGCTQMKSFTLTEPAVALTLNETSKTPTSCNGSTDGSVTVQGAGGDGSYLYSKDGTNFQASNTFTGLGAGAQDIWVRDGLGCEVKTTISIVSPPALVPKVVSISHVDCNGGNNGSVTLGADGGEGDYTYSTNATGGFTTNPTFTILSATTYTYYVRTKNKCTTPINFTINEPAVLTASVDVSKTKPISCFGTNDGEVTLNIAGGTSDYMVSVDGGTPVTINAPYTISGLSRGDHTLRISDAKGCFVEIASGTINEPTVVQVSLVSSQNSGCTTSTGSAEVTASGGTGAYTFKWINLANGMQVSTNATATGLGVGSYRAEVLDGNNCLATRVVNISSIGAPQMRVTSTSPASCTAAADGSATIEITSGGPSVTVVWDNGQTGLTATGLTPGDHQVTLTDNGCQAVKTVNIPLGAQMVIQATSQINPKCFGDSNGSLSVSVTNGVAPYTYTWSNGSSGNSINGLAAGTYTVTVRDAKGCEQMKSFQLTAPSALAISIKENKAPDCFNGNNGRVEVEVSGGTGAYSYSWAHDNSETTAVLANVSAGVYEVTIRDANGCEAKQSIRVDNAIEITATVNKTLPSCGNAGDGQMVATAAGGVGGYTYLWTAAGSTTTLSTTNTLSNAIAGTYELTITDSKSCKKTLSFTLDNPVQLTLTTLTSTNPTCFGGVNGVLKVQGQGGKAPYTYAWDDGQTGAEAIGLKAGTHRVTVTDDNRCAKTFDLLLTEPVQLLVQLTNKKETACELNKGSAEVSVSGGTGSYTYEWRRLSDNALISTNATANNLNQGDYRVDVKDANNCAKSLTVTIGSVAAADMQVTNLTPASCATAGDGTATIQITAGVAPVTVRWEDGQTGLTATGLSAKIHKVTLTDADGCTVEKTVTIDLAPAMVIQATSQINPKCFGDSNGSLSVSVTNGVAPYAYSWSNGSSGNSISGLAAGTYAVTVRDAKGCEQMQSFQLTAPSALAISIKENKSPDCFNGSNGRVEVEVNGGTTGYTYSWAHDNSEATAILANVGAGVYEVTVRDANGCEAKQSIRVDNAIEITATVNKTLPSCGNAGDGQMVATAAGGVGGYTYIWTAAGSTTTLSTTNTLSGATAGTYELTVTDSKSCKKTLSFTLDNPVQLTLTTLTSTDPSCFGGTNGVLKVQAQGGKAPYTYLWGDNQMGDEATGLTAGTHRVTVTDDNGCAKTFNLQLSEPTQLLVQLANKKETACELGKGSAEVSVSGGAGTYTYEWRRVSDNVLVSNTAKADNLNRGDYRVEVKDANNCAKSLTVTIGSLAAADMQVTNLTPASCATAGDGTATIQITAGVAPVTVRWEGGQTGLTATGLSAKTHKVTLTDADGCTVEKTVTIDLAPAMVIQATSQINPKCFGDNNGSLSVSVTNGVAPYTYSWSNGSSGNSISGLTAGAYAVTVRDAKGCEQMQSFQLTAPSALAISIKENKMPTCFNGCNGRVTVEVSGGTAPYTYQWSHDADQKNATITGACAGVYTVKVTDANGCEINQNIRVEEPTDFVVTAQNESPGCDGASNGKITVSVTGGTAPYTYRWDAPGKPGVSNTAVLENVSSGAYTLTISDANGCSQTNTYVLDNPAPLAVNLETAASSDPSCHGAINGVLKVQAQGGVAPYSYAWDNGQTGNQATGLAAGTHTVTVTDAKGCSVVAAYELFAPAPVALSLPENITLCPGQTYQVNLQNIGSQYTWTRDGNFFSNDREIAITEAGSYELTAVTFKGCTVTAKMEVLVSADALNADFVLVDKGVVGDTIAAIDLSFPLPERIEWKVSGTDTDRTILSDQGFYEHQIIFNKAGIYTVTLYTASSSCQDSLTQTIEIFETEQEAEGGRTPLGYQAKNKVEKALIYPNPTSGTFKVHVKLSKPGQARVSIRSSYTAANLDTQVKNGEDEYTFAFNLTNLTYGVYFAVIETKDHTEVLKIMVN